MQHLTSQSDERFLTALEDGQFPVADFDHRAHLRLAYIYLVKDSPPEQSVRRMKATLIHLLERAGIDPVEKYHETLTTAWILAVRHFMNKTSESESADTFIERNPIMLDSKIMLTHYSTELLFSPQARVRFVEPNLDPIPRH